MPSSSGLRPIHAVVFDLDGLMFNSEDIFHEVGERTLRRRGKQLTQELHTRMLGRRAPEAMQICIDYHELDDTVEDLLHEWEQSQLEEEIVAVARTELDQHSSEMNQSFGQYLAEVEQSWDQTQPESVQVAIRGMQRRSSVANATAASADQRTEDNPSRSRGLLTWLPHESLVGYSNSHSQDMRDSRASHSGALQQQSRIPSENNNRLLEERSDQPALKADAAPESLRRRSGASSPPPAPAAAPQAPPNPNRFAKAEESLEAVPVEGRQIRRVLIRIVPRPAG